MLIIHVTSEIVGSATLTEQAGSQGRKAAAALYAANIVSGCGTTHHFGVTRCSSRQVFGKVPKREIYGWLGECPPNVNGKPYQAIEVRHPGTGTFALRLYDEYSPHQDTLRGMGPILRNNILIHIGDPACSFGCLTVGGGLTELNHLQEFIYKHRDTGRPLIQVHIAER